MLKDELAAERLSGLPIPGSVYELYCRPGGTCKVTRVDSSGVWLSRLSRLEGTGATVICMPRDNWLKRVSDSTIVKVNHNQADFF